MWLPRKVKKLFLKKEEIKAAKEYLDFIEQVKILSDKNKGFKATYEDEYYKITYETEKNPKTKKKED